MLLTVRLSVFAGTVYWVRGHIEFDITTVNIADSDCPWFRSARRLFAVKAWSLLDRYLLLYGDNGVVVGASYTDVHVGLPAFVIGLSVIAAIASWANLRARTYRLPAAAILLFGGGFVLAEVFPGLFRQFFVRPNELELERPYIEQNITLTRQAYNLDRMRQSLPAEQKLTPEALEANQATIDNIRLWDGSPCGHLPQLQEIRTYYKFGDLDVDRYWLDGSYQR